MHVSSPPSLWNTTVGVGVASPVDVGVVFDSVAELDVEVVRRRVDDLDNVYGVDEVDDRDGVADRDREVEPDEIEPVEEAEPVDADEPVEEAEPPCAVEPDALDRFEVNDGLNGVDVDGTVECGAGRE